MKGMIGIEHNDIGVVVTHVPGRRKPQLCVVLDSEPYPVASFASEGRADWFLYMMQEFLGGDFDEAVQRYRREKLQ